MRLRALFLASVALALPLVAAGRSLEAAEAPVARVEAVGMTVSDMDRALRPPEPVVADPKVGRNDPCPCGSGKKYKKCCEDLPPAG